MTEQFQKQMDAEEESRIKEIESGPKPDTFDEFATSLVRYSEISDLLKKDKSYLPSFVKNEMALAAPFNEALLVSLCPICMEDIESLKPFLETGYVVPILSSKYESYSPKAFKEIIKYPHMSAYEAGAYRGNSLYARHSRGVCPHCVQKQYDESLKALGKSDVSPEYKEALDRSFRNLSPYVEDDFDLFDELAAAIGSNDEHTISQIEHLTWMVGRARTVEAFDAKTTINIDDLEKVVSIVGYETRMAIQETREILVDGLGIGMPDDMPVDKYLEIIDPHRSALQSILAEIVRGSKDSASGLTDRIASINEEIRRAEKKTKYKVVTGTMSVIGENKALTTALLTSAALGLAGNLMGCGMGLMAGLVGEVAKRTGKIKTKALGRTTKPVVHRIVAPAIDRLMSRYLPMELSSVQIWRIRREIEGG